MIAEYNKRKSIKLPRQMWEDIEDACKRFNCSVSDYIGAIAFNYCQGNITADLRDYQAYMGKIERMDYEQYCYSLFDL